MTQSNFANKSLLIWLLLHRVEKILTNSNYIVRGAGTYYRHCVHRIRLSPVAPQSPVGELSVINFEIFQYGSSLVHFLPCWKMPPQLLQNEM